MNEKDDLIIWYLQKAHFRSKVTNKLKDRKCKRIEKIIHIDSNQKTVKVAILKSNKTDIY
jgi:hypothetical protein